MTESSKKTTVVATSNLVIGAEPVTPAPSRNVSPK